ncbi:septum formation initiator family protein [Tumebacillus sp. ITR2]|uniref:Septum formation initiator family protein n=1 Tax=Tumebacillus amylolyticus TaxID=2801339 RepID=A0ABS1JGI2_9BACL|nr:septum formation initiator family protein [Tumebacillus amylolyticus]MBL0389119.1 septum formation initiator family protein [Tumebacillus amylolyticus]
MSKGRTNVYSMTQDQETKLGAASPAAARNTAAKRRMKLKPRRILLLGMMAWAVYVFFFVQSPDLKRLDQQQTALNHDMSQAQQTNADLQKRVELLQDPDYIAQLARSKFMMVKDGETLFVEPKQEATKP